MSRVLLVLILNTFYVKKFAVGKPFHYILVPLIYFIGIMSPYLRGGGRIVFGANPVGVSISIVVGLGITLSCLQNIL